MSAGKVTLTYNGQTVEVDAEALGNVMYDARDRMDDRLVEVYRYPQDYDQWSHDLIAANIEAREAVLSLVFGDEQGGEGA